MKDITSAEKVLRELKGFLREYNKVSDQIKDLTQGMEAFSDECGEFYEFYDFDRYPIESFGRYKAAGNLLLWEPKKGKAVFVARFESSIDALREATTMNSRYFDEESDIVSPPKGFEP